MTFDELREFLESKMRMSHVYQPLLIRSLVDAGGAATLRQLALAFLGYDESQILFYEKRIKEMPLRVLKGHGVVEQDGQLVHLSVGRLTFEQRAVIRGLCEKKMQEFIQKRGLGLWDYRMLDTDPVPDSLRNQLLLESGGRCAFCGATKTERPLDVDHIIPRSLGGTNTLENLQILCSKCNRSKGNKNDLDFRQWPTEESHRDCPFCSEAILPRVTDTNGSVFVVQDAFPVTPDHQLIIPKRHVADYFDLSERERLEANELMRVLRNRIRQNDPSVLGFNVGVNCGEVAGQTIMHAHIHLVPRRRGDTPDPRGGVRGAVPGKMMY